VFKSFDDLMAIMRGSRLWVLRRSKCAP
jgi:phage gp46-like protein